MLHSNFQNIYTLSVSSLTSGAMCTNIMALACPHRESCSSCVSLLLRKGMCACLLARADMTSPAPCSPHCEPCQVRTSPINGVLECQEMTWPCIPHHQNAAASRVLLACLMTQYSLAHVQYSCLVFALWTSSSMDPLTSAWTLQQPNK